MNYVVSAISALRMGYERAMYDEFSSDYDRFVNWPGRLAVEMPFVEAQLQAAAASSGNLVLTART